MWKSTDKNPPRGVELLCYSAAWIDEDFNKEGIRAATLTDDGECISARWYDSGDCYISDTQTTYPELYFADLPSPVLFEQNENQLDLEL